jgi:uncharacterized protein (DUF2141 family)
VPRVLVLTFACLTPLVRLAAADLTVVVHQVRNDKGVVGALVFNSPQGWPERFASAVRREAVPAHPGTVTISFKDLPKGSYAVVVLHDENENKKLERNWLGKPKEGWGMSNNPKPLLSAPSFESARFQLGETMTLEIRLRY